MNAQTLTARGQAAGALIALVGLIALVDLMAVGEQLALLTEAWSPTDPEAAFDAVLARRASLDTWWRAGSVCAGLAFVDWFARAHAATATRRRKGVVLAFFIPIYNLFAPYRHAVEIWLGSTGGVRRPALVSGWWLAWVATVLGGRLAASLYRHADSRGDMVIATAVDAAHDVITIVAAALAMAFIGRISQWHDWGYGPPRITADADAERLAEAFD